jgi:hypothetical protein
LRLAIGDRLQSLLATIERDRCAVAVALHQFDDAALAGTPIHEADLVHANAVELPPRLVQIQFGHWKKPPLKR